MTRRLTDGQRAAAVRAQIPHLSANDLRRTFATWHAEQGIPLELLMRAMGHTSPQMLARVYARPKPARVRARLLRGEPVSNEVLPRPRYYLRRDSRPQRPYNLRPVIDAATPPALLLAARSLPETRDAALAELRRRLAEHATAASPGDLARATGIAERTLRRLLAELDAAGLPVAVGWVRARGGGMARARAARRDRAARE